MEALHCQFVLGSPLSLVDLIGNTFRGIGTPFQLIVVLISSCGGGFDEGLDMGTEKHLLAVGLQHMGENVHQAVKGICKHAVSA